MSESNEVPASPRGSEPTDGELAALRAENERLRSQVAQLGTEPPRSKSHWVRSTAVVLLMSLGFLLVPASLVALWTHNQLMNNDRYVQMVTPLASDPAVQTAIANDISAQVWTQVDVQPLLEQYLPPKLVFAAPALASQIEGQVNGLILKAVQSPAFATVWVQANGTAHAAIVKLLNGDTSSNVSIVNNQLVVDLGPYIAQIKQQLIASGLSVASNIPSVNPTVAIPIANIAALQKARQAMHLLNVLTYVLPLLVILFFGLAIWLSRDRRRTVIWTGLLIALGAVVIGLGLGFGRVAYLGAVPSTQFPESAAASVYDTVVGFIKSGNRMVFALGIVIAIAAAVTGPYGWAVKLRGMFGGAIASGGQKTGLDTGPVGAWAARHARALRIALVVVAAVVLLAWSYPTANVVFWLAVAVLLGFVIIQFLAATGSGDAGSDAGSDAGAAPGEPERQSVDAGTRD